MKVRGRNGKWLGTRDWGTVGISQVDVVPQFGAGVSQVGRGVDTFIVIDIVERCAEVSHHERVRGKNRSRSGRGSVNGKEGVNSGELAVDFFFLDVEEVSDVLNHLLVRKSHLAVCRAVRRGRSNEVRGVASTINGRRGVGRNENGGG